MQFYQKEILSRKKSKKKERAEKKQRQRARRRYREYLDDATEEMAFEFEKDRILREYLRD